MKNIVKPLIKISFALLIFNCSGDDSTCTTGENIDCGIDDWRESFYKLPYPAGSSYRVNQGNNNSCGGHQGDYIFGYDFDMPIGSIVVASRGGLVTEIRNDNPDGENLILGNENLVKILHDDGSTAAYSHLKQGSVVVEMGQSIVQGDTLGLSGNSGFSGNFPHLHFHVSNCDEPTLPNCTTLLVKFNNTASNPCGLVQNVFYTAN